MKISKKGSAIALSVIFATVLLTMGLAYAKLTNNNKKQTVQVDERVKLQYLAHSLTELALLKFQLFPADYYACKTASEAGDISYLNTFTVDAPEFRALQDSISKSSYFDKPVELRLDRMIILTGNKHKYNDEALYISSTARYHDATNDNEKRKTVERIVYLRRRTIIPQL